MFQFVQRSGSSRMLWSLRPAPASTIPVGAASRHHGLCIRPVGPAIPAIPRTQFQLLLFWSATTAPAAGSIDLGDRKSVV